MDFAVDPWDPGYGSTLDSEALEPSKAAVDPTVEVPAASWAPQSPADVHRPERILFIDGVRRIDARVWITGEDGVTRPGIAASYAAGVVCCDGAARVLRCEVRRGVFSAAPTLAGIRTRHAAYEPCAVAGEGVEQLSLGLQQRMGKLEALVAEESHDADLVVVDGPLNKLSALACAVGYVKTHQRSYLPPELAGVVTELTPGQRTPLFLTTAAWSRFSWYTRLPGDRGHAWAGVVRGEVSGDLAPAEARRLADTATATLPAYASTAHKDPRAPQNLYPIAELERTLRRHLGDAQLAYRSLRLAAAGALR